MDDDDRARLLAAARAEPDDRALQVRAALCMQESRAPGVDPVLAEILVETAFACAQALDEHRALQREVEEIPQVGDTHRPEFLGPDTGTG